MTTSVLSSALLEQSDPAAFTQRLFLRGAVAPADSAPTTSADVLASLDRSNNTTAQQNFFADLNTARTQQYGATYGATGSASRSSTNTILVGYG